MFENEIKFISDFSLNKIKNFGSFVTYENLASSELHPAIVSYISAELDYMIYRDRKKLLHDSIFDYTGREISDHFNVIAAEIKKTKKISIDDIEKLIFQAVSFNLNYVVRPKWSVTKLVFNDQDFVSVDELEKMLNYLFYYDYVKNVLSAYTSRRKVTQLTLTEFDLILNKIDRELFKANTEELINNAIHSIADFFNIGGIDKTRISLAALEIFLKEKNLIDYLLKLRHSISSSFRKKYEIADIKKVLYSTETVFPESIQGSMEKGLSDTHTGEPLTEDVKSESEQSEKSIGISGNDDTDIFTEEKIKSKDDFEDLTSDDIIIGDNQDETIPDYTEKDIIEIEEETQSEFNEQKIVTDNDELNINTEESAKDELPEIDSINEPSELESIDESYELSPADEPAELDSNSDLSFEDELMGIFDEDKESEVNIKESNVEPLKENVIEDNDAIIIEDEQTITEESDNKEDDLAAFYERELADMDEVELTQNILEEKQETVENKLTDSIEHSEEKSPVDKPLNEEIVDETDKYEEEIVDKTEEPGEEVIEEIIDNDDNMDFSIFDDQDNNQELNEILNKVSTDFQEELAKSINKEESVIQNENNISAFKEEELDIDEENDIRDEIDDVDLTDTGKQIIDEMLEDYFGENDKKKEVIDSESGGETLEDKTEISEDKGPEENLNSVETETPPKSLQDKPEEKPAENLFDTDLASDILDGTSLGDDISSMMDEIDDIIEQNTLNVSETEDVENKTDTEHPSESELDEEFKMDEDHTAVDSPNVENNFKSEASNSIEEVEITGDAYPKEIEPETKPLKQSSGHKAPVREKDLFSYLSRKEVKKIVSGVFASDYEDFATTIEKISECSAYKEATEILKGVFFTYRISPYSKEAVILTNSVSHYFRQA